MTLRISTPEREGTYQGSKYLKYQVLCDENELGRLFQRLGAVWMYRLTGLNDGAPIEPGRFLLEYAQWMAALREGRVPSDQALRSLLASAWTVEPDALWKQEVPGKQYIVKLAKPVVQVQAHFFTYSALDEVFRPMTMGPGNIFWGLQFSFPQIYQDPKTMEFLEVEECPNATLFQTIKQWVRDETRATPFVVAGKKTNVPIRLGKGCFSWIHRHPQLNEQKIGVYAS
ncbi:MAG: hypothetical protein KGQ49_05485 [Verrucomicrobia bacterium]|nr:hypothetical protein [Verrucomicrobiota bacterium]MBU6446832.1 hypothetical protein [Verrucomicrobiota bacterium]MDE3047417.1 hypothetical protein [Verrucomicrobiota bacterium]